MNWWRPFGCWTVDWCIFLRIWLILRHEVSGFDWKRLSGGDKDWVCSFLSNNFSNIWSLIHLRISTNCNSINIKSSLKSLNLLKASKCLDYAKSPFLTVFSLKYRHFNPISKQQRIKRSENRWQHLHH